MNVLQKGSSLNLNGIFPIEVNDMNKIVIGSISVISTLIWSSLASSEPPSGVGVAEPSEGSCRARTVVGPPGDFLPGLDGVHGVISSRGGFAKRVVANSAEGTASFTCHWKSTDGEVVAGFDAFTELPATGTQVSNEEACAALEAFGLPGACKGNGAMIINAEWDGSSCGFGERSTLDWTRVRAKNGQSLLSCRFKD